jgi:actin-related protein
MYPRSIVRSLVEKKSTTPQSDETEAPQKWVYQPVIEADYQQGCVDNDGYENPCINGVVSNWDAMQVLLQQTFDQLKVSMAVHCPSKHPDMHEPRIFSVALNSSLVVLHRVHATFAMILQINPPSTRILVTDPPLNSESNRMKMLEMLFETFGFSRVLIQPSAVLALYSQGVSHFHVISQLHLHCFKPYVVG